MRWKDSDGGTLFPIGKFVVPGTVPVINVRLVLLRLLRIQDQLTDRRTAGFRGARDLVHSAMAVDIPDALDS